MATLIYTVEGDQSDLDFLRDRFDGALDGIIDEYKQNLDGPVTVDWEWGQE